MTLEVSLLRREEAQPEGSWNSFWKMVKSDPAIPDIEKAEDDTLSTVSHGMFSSTSDNKTVVSETISDTESVLSQEMHAPIPERLVDFFCVIGPDLCIPEKEFESPSDLKFKPLLIDCVPKSRDDVDFPEQLPMFCFPHDCKVTTEPKESSVYSFVLTAGTGHRLYLSAAIIYDKIRIEELCDLFWRNSRTLPSWLPDETSHENDVQFYLPKAVVVVSHHPFYSAQTTFLRELLNIQKSGASLPLERYVANFVYDIPMPFPGGAVIRWDCFSKGGKYIELARSSVNKLPLVNFSYQPLFRTLSITNILVLWGILLQEGRVVLCSDHLSLLTPIVESLLSLLFPFNWHGMYVPILPSNMLDALDAPVPYLVGINGDCVQPEGVVVCDLDQDVVHLGFDDWGNERSMPILPRNLVLQLKSELSEIADPMYLIPACGLKGRVFTGEQKLMPNESREIYGHMSVLKEGSIGKDLRGTILSESCLVKIGSAGERLEESEMVNVGPSPPIQSIQISTPKEDESTKRGKGLNRRQRVVGLSYAGMERQRAQVAASFYDIDKDLETSVRTSFLKFFTSLLKEYKGYTSSKGGGDFQAEAFLDLFVGNSKACAESLINTQMFERFLNESSTRRKLFDEYISLHWNESFKKLKEKENREYEARLRKEVIIPTGPCKAGIKQKKTFTYKSFPKLDESELVSNSNVILDSPEVWCDAFRGLKDCLFPSNKVDI